MSYLQRLLELDPCCGCINLLVGTVVIAGIEVITSLAASVTYILALSAMNSYQTGNSFGLSRSELSLFLNFQGSSTSTDGINNKLWQAFGLGLFFSITTLAVSLSLLYGVKRGSIKLLKGWLLFKAVGISLSSIYLLRTIVLAQATGIGILLDLTEISVLFYCLWVVYAFMKELVEEQVLKMSPSIIQTQGKIEVSFPL